MAAVGLRKYHLISSYFLYISTKGKNPSLLGALDDSFHVSPDDNKETIEMVIINQPDVKCNALHI